MTRRRWFALVLIGPAVWAIGLLLFLRQIPLAPQGAIPATDAIVVLTGPEPARLSRGFDLFAQGAAPRLLISGVEPGLTMDRTLRMADRAGLRLPPGVTLGTDAADTVGNAREVGAWVCAHGVHSLVLITADYHMPRALWLLRQTLPATTIIPDPILWGHGSRQPMAYHGMRGLWHRLGEYHKDIVQHLLRVVGALRLTPVVPCA